MTVRWYQRLVSLFVDKTHHIFTTLAEPIGYLLSDTIEPVLLLSCGVFLYLNGNQRHNGAFV